MSSSSPISHVTESSNQQTLIYQDYFSYGLNHSLLANLSGHDDHQIGPFQIPVGFHAFTKTFSKLYILINGLATLIDHSGFNNLLLCPFNADIDTRENGVILHGEITQADLLYSIGLDIQRACNESMTTPLWAYIVTWFEVRPYFYQDRNDLYGTQSMHKNTFQLVLASNRQKSFAIHNYMRLDWPNNEIDTEFTSGYIKSFVEEINTIKISESRVDLLTNSNIGRPGRWVMAFNNPICTLNSF